MQTIIDKDSLDKFFKEELSVKEANLLEEKIVERVDEIIAYLYKSFEDFDYWAFNSLGESEEGVGKFETYYEDNIEYILGKTTTYNGQYQDSIPTKWLYEDYKAEIDFDVNHEIDLLKKTKEDKKNEETNLKNDNIKRVQNIEKVIGLQQSIMSKLTDEEKSIIGFKQFMEISPNLDEVLKFPNLPKQCSSIVGKKVVDNYLKEQELSKPKKRRM